MAAAAQLGINQWNCWLAIIPIIAGEGWQYCISYLVAQFASEARTTDIIGGTLLAAALDTASPPWGSL